MKTIILIVSVLLSFTPVSNVKSEKEPIISLIKQENKLDITCNNQLITSYLFADTLKKPFFFPLYSTSGTRITRGYPFQPNPYERIDHYHQTGVWFNFGDVNGVDFWNNSKIRPLEEKHKYGTIRLKNLNILSNNTNPVAFSVKRAWFDSQNNILLNEEVIYELKIQQNRLEITRKTKLTAASKSVKLSDNKEGLFAIRVAREFELPSNRKELKLNKETTIAENMLYNQGVNGNFISSNGKSDHDVWGTANKWVCLNAYVESTKDSISIALFDHHDNFGYPSHYHARDYGLFSVDNFGRKAFVKNLESIALELKKGESIELKHKLIVKDHGFLHKKEIEKLHKQFQR